MSQEKPYGAQVTLEKTFSSKAAAEAWMERVKKATLSTTPDHVEVNLWEPVK